MLFLDHFFLYARESVATLGVCIILIGALCSLYQFLFRKIYTSNTINNVRIQFGNYVILGLEFMVGADIIGSLIKPDYYSLGLLAILVVIRTILSYFLNLELQHPSARQQSYTIKNQQF